MSTTDEDRRATPEECPAPCKTPGDCREEGGCLLGYGAPVESETETPGLEVQVWLRCESTEDLWRLNQELPHSDDGDAIPPPDGRRDLVCTWEVPEGWNPEPDAEPEPWQDAFLYGFGQAAHQIEKAAELGIDTYVYAVRVQPVDAEFRPLVAATTSELSRERAEAEEDRIDA